MAHYSHAANHEGDAGVRKLRCVSCIASRLRAPSIAQSLGFLAVLILVYVAVFTDPFSAPTDSSSNAGRIVIPVNPQPPNPERPAAPAEKHTTAWLPLAPAPLTSTADKFTHVTAFERRVAEQLNIPEAQVKQCVRGPLTIGWQPDDFGDAVNEHIRFKEASEQRVEAASSDRTGKSWAALTPRFSPCTRLERFGDVGDGGKWICNIESLQDPCIIYSLGSKAQIGFEESMVANTPCQIFTFDCTVRPEKFPKTDPRITFLPKCIGANSADGKFQTLPTLMAKLHHESLAFLKMDIEGSEYRFLDTLYETAKADWKKSFAVLPDQIAFEIHQLALPKAKIRNESVAAMFKTSDRAYQQLLNMGYTLVSRERNPFCVHCHELLFVRLPEACWSSPPILQLLDEQ